MMRLMNNITDKSDWARKVFLLLLLLSFPVLGKGSVLVRLQLLIG